jgi:hypothetical protein
MKGHGGDAKACRDGDSGVKPCICNDNPDQRPDHRQAIDRHGGLATLDRDGEHQCGHDHDEGGGGIRQQTITRDDDAG